MTVDQLDSTIHKIYFAFESAEDEHYSSDYISHWIEMYYSDIDPENKLFTSAAAAKSNAMQYIGIEFPTELIKFYYGADWYNVDTSITDIKSKDTLIDEAFVPLRPTFNQLRSIYDKADFLRIRRPKTSFAKWYTMNKEQLNSEVNRVKAYYNLRALPVKEGDYFFHKNTGKWLATNELEKFEEANGGFEKTVVWINGDPTPVDNPQSFIDKLRSLFESFRQRIINGINSVWDWLCKVFPALRHVENAFDAASNGLYMVDTNLVNVHDGIINWFVGNLADSEDGYGAAEIVGTSTDKNIIKGFAHQRGAFTGIGEPEDPDTIDKSDRWLSKILGRVGDFFEEVDQKVRGELAKVGISFDKSKLSFTPGKFSDANPLQTCDIFAFTGTITALKDAGLLDDDGKPKFFEDAAERRKKFKQVWADYDSLRCFQKLDSDFLFKRRTVFAKPVVLVNNSEHLPSYSDTSGENPYTPEFLYNKWEAQLKDQYFPKDSNERFLPEVGKDEYNVDFYFETDYDPNAADNTIPYNKTFINAIGGARMNCILPKIQVNFSFADNLDPPDDWSLESLNFDWGVPWDSIGAAVRAEFKRLMLNDSEKKYIFNQTHTSDIPLCRKDLNKEGDRFVYNYEIDYKEVKKVSITFKNSLWEYGKDGYEFNRHTKNPNDSSQDSEYEIKKFPEDEITLSELSKYKNYLAGAGQKTEFQGYIANTSEDLTTEELTELVTEEYPVPTTDSFIHFVNYEQLTLSYEFPEPGVDYVKEEENFKHGQVVQLSNRVIFSTNFFLENWYESYKPETDDFGTELTEITMDSNKTVYGKMARQATVNFIGTDFQSQKKRISLKDKWYYSERHPNKTGAEFLGVYDNDEPPFDGKVDRSKDINAIALEEKNTDFYGIFGYKITLPTTTVDDAELTYHDFNQKERFENEENFYIKAAINESLTLPTHVSITKVEYKDGVEQKKEVHYKPRWKKEGEDLFLGSSYKFNSDTTLEIELSETKKKVTIKYITKNGEAYTDIGSEDYYLDQGDRFVFPSEVEATVDGQNNTYPVKDFYSKEPGSIDFNPNDKILYTSFQIADGDNLFYAIVETTETLYRITTKYQKHSDQSWQVFDTREITAWYGSGQKVYLEPYYLKENTYYQVEWYDGATDIKEKENEKFVYEVSNSTTLVGKLQPTQHWKVEFYDTTGERVQINYYADEARLGDQKTPALDDDCGWYSGETTDSQQYTDESLITTNLVLREMKIPTPPEESEESTPSEEP